MPPGPNPKKLCPESTKDEDRRDKNQQPHKKR
jgi:hypothetical protein